MATFSYDHNEDHVYSISQNNGGMPTVRLTVDELANFLKKQNFVCKDNFEEAAELMFKQGLRGQVLDSMVIKALDRKKVEMT